jgi:hypothetical protein
MWEESDKGADLTRGRKVVRQARNRQWSRALILRKETRSSTVHARAAMQFNVRRPIPDVSTGTAGDATRLRRLT